jgi:hypothetical protein
VPNFTPTPRVANYFLHYTSREGAQGIAAVGYVVPGRSGIVWLTKDLYTFGADAADRLGIVNKPVEVAFLVSPSPSAVVGPFVVEPVREPGGRLDVNPIRRGLGTEYRIMSSVAVPREKEARLVLGEP